MTRNHVSSTSLKSVGYENGILEIEFHRKNTLYQFWWSIRNFRGQDGCKDLSFPAPSSGSFWRDPVCAGTVPLSETGSG